MYPSWLVLAKQLTSRTRFKIGAGCYGNRQLSRRANDYKRKDACHSSPSVLLATGENDSFLRRGRRWTDRSRLCASRCTVMSQQPSVSFRRRCGPSLLGLPSLMRRWWCPLSCSVVTSGVRSASTGNSRLVLGIETSCDETGAAVVNEDGDVLGEGLYSQKRIHVKNGGIIPFLAQDLHRQHIHPVVGQALQSANIQLDDVDALATTTMPGLALCLQVGLEYSKAALRRRPKMKFIPVHHMVAHALTIRMIEKVDFPYLVLLISGGHCLLAVAKGVDKFLLLGQTRDNAPGDAFDKVARRLKLATHPGCVGLSGGQAIERVAVGGNIRLLMDKHRPLLKHRDCNFSFSGLMGVATWMTYNHEIQQGISLDDDRHLATVSDIAASFQHQVAHHLVSRVARAMEFCRQADASTGNLDTLVVSGGVASNAYIRHALHFLCGKNGYQFHCPPPDLCTDNGIMIAWAGMEKLKLGIGTVAEPDTVRYEPRWPIGENISDQVRAADIKMKRMKFW